MFLAERNVKLLALKLGNWEIGNDDKAELLMFGSKLQDGKKKSRLEVGNKTMTSKGTKRVFLLCVSLIHSILEL